MRGVQPDGQAIRRLRKAQGLTQEGLAAQACCSARTVRSAEQGNSIDARTLSLIAEALDLPYLQLCADSSQSGNDSSNLDLAKSWLDAFMAADWEKMKLLHHPDHTIELPGADDMLGGDHPDVDQVEAHMQTTFELFEPLEARDEVFDAAGEFVFHRATMTGRIKQTGFILEARYFNEFEIRDGLIFRRLTISDLKEHRKAWASLDKDREGTES